jgi:hypothetical protein
VRRLPFLLLIIGSTPAVADSCPSGLIFRHATKASFVPVRYKSGEIAYRAHPHVFQIEAYQGRRNGRIVHVWRKGRKETGAQLWASGYKLSIEPEFSIPHMPDPHSKIMFDLISGGFRWKPIQAAAAKGSAMITSGPLEGEWTISCR